MSAGECSGECGCGARGTATQVREPLAAAAQTEGRGSAGMSRRGVLVGSAMVAASLALAACADTSEAETPPTTPTPEESTPTAQETPEDDESTPAPGGGEELTTTSAFPTGGGAVVSSSLGNLVVTQPADGEFKAFNARCPHAGCTVDEVKENVIECPCHGSTFDAATGEHLEGPAPTGLTPVAVTVSGDKVLLA